MASISSGGSRIIDGFYRNAKGRTVTVLIDLIGQIPSTNLQVENELQVSLASGRLEKLK
jgi:hypothetical protein